MAVPVNPLDLDKLFRSLSDKLVNGCGDAYPYYLIDLALREQGYKYENGSVVSVDPEQSVSFSPVDMRAYAALKEDYQRLSDDFVQLSDSFRTYRSVAEQRQDGLLSALYACQRRSLFRRLFKP